MMEHLSDYLKDQGIVAQDTKSVKLFSDALSVASTDANVLITGESGTGKGILARFLHNHSQRRLSQFVHVNCSAIPAELFESEFFGYEAGTFTGQSSYGKSGLVSQAAGGTLFLDEIGDLSVTLQAKLLQVIQEHSVRSIGSQKEQVLDIRIIAATNRNLEDMVRDGLFRLDLYYRLNTVALEVPPLRQRRQDIRGLLDALSEAFISPTCPKKEFTENAVRWLQEQSWPGNIRELQNFMERLYVLEDRTEIDADYLKEHYHFPSLSISNNTPDFKILPLNAAVASFEKNYIRSVLKKVPNTAAAAAILGIDVFTLNQKLHH